MVAYYYSSNPPFRSGYVNKLDPFSNSFQDFNGASQGGLVGTQALVLDSEKGELVKAPARVAKKGLSEAKALAALKSHSDAERRRRERINGHLSTLRGLVPCNEKMDKATLLAEVIKQVKELKKSAIEASKGVVVPMEEDEVNVEYIGSVNGTLSFKASLCCDFRPQLLSDIRQTIDGLQLRIINSEISTLGGRLKNELVFTGKNVACDEAPQLVANSIKQALSSALEKDSALLEYSPRTTLPNKRRRVSFFDSSSSSS